LERVYLYDDMCMVGMKRGMYLCCCICVMLISEINECDEAIHNCTQKCVNIEGDFECECHPGFLLV